MTYFEWLPLMQSMDSSDRIEAADNPPLEPAEDVRALLVGALADEVSLVRTCAADSLSRFGSASLAALKLQLAKEKDQLCRAYLQYSICLVGEPTDIASIISTLTNESRHQAILGMTGAILGLQRQLLALGGTPNGTNSEHEDAFMNAVAEISMQVDALKQLAKAYARQKRNR